MKPIKAITKGKVIIQNASQVALVGFQKEMVGEAEKAGIKSENDVVTCIKELRASQPTIST